MLDSFIHPANKRREETNTTRHDMPVVIASPVIRGKLSLSVLRVRPEDQGREYRVHESAPDGYSWDVMSGPVVLAHENDVPNDVQKSEQHVYADQYQGSYRRCSCWRMPELLGK